MEGIYLICKHLSNSNTFISLQVVKACQSGRIYGPASQAFLQWWKCLQWYKLSLQVCIRSTTQPCQQENSAARSDCTDLGGQTTGQKGDAPCSSPLRLFLSLCICLETVSQGKVQHQKFPGEQLAAAVTALECCQSTGKFILNPPAQLCTDGSSAPCSTTATGMQD